jgi:hypothetical protein
MINGGAKETKVYRKIWTTTFEYPMEDLETGFIGHLNFTDLKILPREYGEFTFIFSVNGIQSDYYSYTNINIAPIKMTAKRYILKNFEVFIVILTGFAVLMTNTPYNTMKWWGFSVFICIFGILMILWNQGGNAFWSFSMLVLITMYIVCLMLIFKDYRKGRTHHRIMFF